MAIGSTPLDFPRAVRRMRQPARAGLPQTTGFSRLDNYSIRLGAGGKGHPLPPIKIALPKATRSFRISKTSPKNDEIGPCQSHSGSESGARARSSVDHVE